MNTTDSTTRLTEMQTRGLENAFAFGRLATTAFERLARQNYAVMGDVVDYTLAQIRIPTQHADPRAALEAQAARTRELAERARVRADEYVAIAGEVRELVGGAMNRPARAAASVAAPAAPAPSPKAPAARRSAARAASATTSEAPVDASADVGGTPIILPEDSPRTAVKKTAVAAASTTPAAKTASKPAARPATKRTASKRGAATAKPATAKGPGGARAAAKRTGRTVKG